jgi:hypothetical protein
LKKDDQYGRYIITNRDLKVGTVVAIEEAFSKNVLPEFCYERCNNCLSRNLLNLIPCEYCTLAMYCSEECKKIGWEKNHRFECDVVDSLYKFFSEWLMSVRTFLQALDIFNGDPNALKDFLSSIKNPNATVFDFDFSGMNDFENKKSTMHSIDSMVTNEALGTDADLFQRSLIGAMITNLMLNHSKLGSVLIDKDTRAMFRKFIFKQSRILSFNYHGLYRLSEETVSQNPDQYGSGCFPFCSLLNHSCAPNIGRINYLSKIVLYVIEPIQAGDQLFENYG